MGIRRAVEHKLASMLTVYKCKENNQKEMEEINVYRSIKAIRGIVICKTDKTPPIVAMNKNIYHEKILKYLQTSGCQRQSSDPTKKIEGQTRRILLRKTVPKFLKEVRPPHFCVAPLLFTTIKNAQRGEPDTSYGFQKDTPHDQCGKGTA